MDSSVCVCATAKGYGEAISVPFQCEVCHALNCEAFAQQILSQCDSEGEAGRFHP